MTDSPPTILLQAGHDRRISGGHPWAYSNELRLDPAAKALPPGTLVRLARADGKVLGIASFNRNTLIAARLLLRDGAATPAAIDGDFLRRGSLPPCACAIISSTRPIIALSMQRVTACRVSSSTVSVMSSSCRRIRRGQMP